MLQRISSFLKHNSNLRLILKLWVYSHLILQISRGVWLIFNHNLIPNTTFFSLFKVFLWGFYFDLPVIAWYLFPLWLWMILFTRQAQAFPNVTKALYLLGINLCLLLNGIDTGYSQITGKRSGPELLYNIADEGNKLSAYLGQAWPGLLGLLLFNAFMVWRLSTQFSFTYPYRSGSMILHFYKYTGKLTGLLIFILCARGGFRLKPLSASDISGFVAPEYAALAGSTPLQMMSGSGDKIIHYKSNETLAADAEKTLHLHQRSAHKQFIRPNIVFIIVESLGREYTGFLNNARFTPFLDSFSKRCLSFTYGYANGTRSVEMASAIFCGIPTLSNSAIINSSYANDAFPSLFKLLKKEGYGTHFFHAAHNQTMGFGSFFNTQGLQHYYGINEYPETMKNQHYDGAWGIFDEPYLQYFIGCMDTMRQPFFSSVFTLSSHHPYNIPAQYRGKLATGKLPIHQSIAYTDMALKKFFETAASKPWFENTLFVITGDHTSYGETDYFYSESGHYEVPMLIYAQKLAPETLNCNISHCGIGATLLDLSGYPRPFFWPESSSLDTLNGGFQIHYNPDKGYYYLLQYPYTLGMDKNGNVTEFYSRVRNSSKIVKLPFSGNTFENLKQALTARLASYSYRINKNAYPSLNNP